jgi:hypothetical protein
MIDRCPGGPLHTFTVERGTVACADCLLSHETWSERGGLEAAFDRSVLARWMGGLDRLED